MKRRAILLLSAMAARKGLATALLVVVNVVHAAIHNTPLDQGMADSFFANLDAWAINTIMIGD